MHVYVTGDVHRYFERAKEIKQFCIDNNTTKEDIMILLGDVGANFSQDKIDKEFKELMYSCPITFICVYGNHELRPKHIPTYTITKYGGARCYVEDKYPNILFPEDGEIYINGNRCLIAGGAYSIDKKYRLIMGYPWFEDEQMDNKTMDRIRSIIKENNKFDYIFSHTAPLSYEPRYLFLSEIDQSKVDKTMEVFLDEVWNSIDQKYLKWYFFGHYHDDKILAPKVRILLNDIIEIK